MIRNSNNARRPPNFSRQQNLDDFHPPPPPPNLRRGWDDLFTPPTTPLLRRPPFPPVPVPSFGLAHMFDERFLDPWSSFDESFPRIPMRQLPFPPLNFTPESEWARYFTDDVEEPRPSQATQEEALKNLKKEIYNPKTKKSAKPSMYYRSDPRNSSTDEKRMEAGDEDGNRCAICLEDFEAREEVTITPCNHMFHEDCITPWVKCHGNCPVCRSSVLKSTRSSNMAVSDRYENEMSSLTRRMEGSFGPFGIMNRRTPY